MKKFSNLIKPNKFSFILPSNLSNNTFQHTNYPSIFFQQQRSFSHNQIKLYAKKLEDREFQNELDEEEFLRESKKLSLEEDVEDNDVVDIEEKHNAGKIKKEKKKPVNKEEVLDRLKSKWVDPQTKIMLIDEAGKKIGEKTFGDARKMGFSKNMRIEWVNDQDGLMVFKLMNTVKVEKKKERKSSSEMDYKEIRFSVMISDHDVEFKEKKINELLRSGYIVKLIVFQKKDNKTPFERELSIAITKNILDRIDKELASHQSINVEENKQETSTFIIPHKQREKKIKEPEKLVSKDRKKIEKK